MTRAVFKLCLSLIAVSIYTSAYAQRDFRQGYIITPGYDTIQGRILYSAANTSNVCTFIKSTESLPVRYTPSQIKGYWFEDGKMFIAKVAPLSGGDRLVFLEYLIKGKANFYYMRDGTDHYFMENDHGTIMELTEPDKIISGVNGVEYVKPKQFTGRLKLLMSDCPEIFPEIDKTNLNHSSLVRLAKDYHSKVCSTEQCVVFERKKLPFHVRFGFFGGFSVNHVKFGAKLNTTKINGLVIVEGDQLVSDYKPGGSVGLRVEFENIFSSFEHASIILDFGIQGFYRYNLTETGEYDKVIYEGTTYLLTRESSLYYRTNLDVNLSTYIIQVPMKFNYTFLKGAYRPYLNAGLMNYFVISQNRKLDVTRFTDEFNKSIPTYHIGFTGSIGVKIMIPADHCIFAEAGYTLTQSANLWPYLRFVNNLFEVKAGISL